MWRVIVCAVVWALAGCSGDCAELRQIVASSMGNEPGTIRSGIMFQTYTGAVAARADGSVMCLTCSGMAMFDAGLHQIGRPNVDEPINLVVAPDDTVYAATSSSEVYPTELVALSPEGEPRWKAEFSVVPSQLTLAAGTEGLYVGAALATGPGSLLTTPTIFRFDAATGDRHKLATNQNLLGAAHSGVFTFESQDEKSVTLHHLDPDGNVVWSHALASTFDGLALNRAVASPDGGVIVLGFTPAALDFGDRTIPDNEGLPFVAGFDAAGATQWVFTLDHYVTDLALSAQGEILLASQSGGGITGPAADAFLFVATPAGVAHTINIDGPGDQYITGLAAAPDGLVWVQVDSGSDDNQPPPAMRIGDHTFTDPATYLFKLVP
jgi:outer membrane protein assembly factor BamB